MNFSADEDYRTIPPYHRAPRMDIAEIERPRRLLKRLVHVGRQAKAQLDSRPQCARRRAGADEL